MATLLDDIHKLWPIYRDKRDLKMHGYEEIYFEEHIKMWVAGRIALGHTLIEARQTLLSVVEDKG